LSKNSRMKRLVAVAAALLGLTALPPAHAAGVPAQDFLHVGAVSGHDGLRQITDAHGRNVILRGVNVNGLVDYKTPDLTPPYPTGPDAYAHGRCPADSKTTTAVPLCEHDLDQIAAIGFDVIRLPVSWSLLEPTAGRLAKAPQDRIAQVVAWAKQRGIRVVIDLHQDAWSKYVYGTGSCPPGSSPATGEDGAPQWASVQVTPACALGGTKELDLAVQESAQRFWLNLPAADGVGLQDHYAKVVTSLARRFGNEPTVAGYELMNEPQPGFLPGVMDSTELMAFHGRVVNAVVAALPRFRQLFFVEPGGTRNVTGARTFVAPWSAYSSYPNVVYAPHVYSEVFTADAIAGQPGLLQDFDSDYAAAIGDANALGLPLWIGEFGNDPRNDRRVLDQHYAHQDAAAIGGALWVWKEHGAWGTLANPSRTTRVTTVFPTATSSAIDYLSSDPFHRTSLLQGHGPAVRRGDTAHATIVSVPALYSGRPFAIGATVQRIGHLLYLYPTGGGWSLRV
jgi:endoglycosylceramidase